MAKLPLIRLLTESVLKYNPNLRGLESREKVVSEVRSFFPEYKEESGKAFPSFESVTRACRSIQNGENGRYKADDVMKEELQQEYREEYSKINIPQGEGFI